MKKLEAEAIVETILDVEAPMLQFNMYVTARSRILNRSRRCYIAAGRPNQAGSVTVFGWSWEAAINRLRDFYELRRRFTQQLQQKGVAA